MKAQKEGEEAVAAYEKEKKDIAEGKIVEPTVKKKAVKATGTGRGRKRKNPESQASISDQTKTKKTKGPKPNQKVCYDFKTILLNIIISLFIF